jgi:chemotaxis family two-component system response regulator Rcp1
MYTMLVVEDPLADGGLMSQMRKALTPLVQVHAVRDGGEALAFLRQEGPYAHAPRPDIIVLDLTRSKKNGQALLAEITQAPQWQRIPVVLLPSSPQPVNIRTALRWGAPLTGKSPRQ